MAKGKTQNKKPNGPGTNQIIMAVLSLIIVLSVILTLFTK